MQDRSIDRCRRTLLSALLATTTASLLPGTGWSRSRAAHASLDNTSPYGPLQSADENGLRLPRSFSARLVAQSGQAVADTGFVWPFAPDGAGMFATRKGWVLVCNAELGAGQGGASALRFTLRGEVTAAYSILGGTTRNCAGGTTPWGTWLSCEEYDDGQVWECDPLGRYRARVRPALGRFAHEAAAVDPYTGQVYLTEDDRAGRLYRFTPARWGDLSSGRLQAAGVHNGQVRWLPASPSEPCRTPETTRFRRGEGAWLTGRTLLFTTTADHRLWVLDVDSGQLEVRYDGKSGGGLRKPDNLTVHPHNGRVFVAEDRDDPHLVLVDARRNPARVAPGLQLIGHAGSELTGPVFSPDGRRLYLSSQRGRDGRGMTFEITGPF